MTTIQDLVDELPLAEHPEIGAYRVIPQMANFSKTPGRLRRAAPLIGEHTHEVVAELRRAAGLPVSVAGAVVGRKAI